MLQLYDLPTSLFAALSGDVIYEFLWRLNEVMNDGATI